MLSRCYNSRYESYNRYGGRHITVCDRWRHSFENFLADMGVKPEGKTLDRYPDNNGNYEPGNCRWATWKEQANNRRGNQVFEMDGVKRPLQEWSKITGLSHQLIQDRITRKKMSVKEALTVPAGETVHDYPNHRIVTFQNKTQNLRAWSRELNIGYDVLRKRHDRGWSVERMLEKRNV